MGGALPRGTRSDVGRMIIYTGLTRNPEELLGIVLTYSLILPVMTSLIAITLGLPNLMIFFAAVVPFVFIWLFFYIFFVLLIDKRTTSVEKVLPDVLTMISQNMVAGMTTYNALWVAARPEFGPLAVEIQTVARETLSGESFEDALVAMSHRVKSYKLTRAVKLMVQGMRSGGELPTVLQEISSDIRTEQNLFKRMSADTTSQAMFILFALLIGAPLLLAASLQFVTMFNTIFSHVDPGESGAATAQIPISKLPIDGDFFTMYAIILLALSGLCGAILIGMMRTGKLSTGVPLTLLLVPLPVIIFIVLATLLGSFFGGLMAGV
ncbi:MAG: type II secretion system F family protein [Candidatus Altiarchaeota archaeon]|nr:type II secretion system F family protein [Candidatus Altiarchaeota archaeon]